MDAYIIPSSTTLSVPLSTQRPVPEGPKRNQTDFIKIRVKGLRLELGCACPASLKPWVLSPALHKWVYSSVCVCVTQIHNPSTGQVEQEAYLL